jgi:hypothetical protein
MNETLSKRAQREFWWFALVLLSLLIVYADRPVSGTLVSSTEAAGDKASTGSAQPGTRP